MPAFLKRFRYAAVAIVSLVLFVGGLVSGSAGNPLILGEQNTAGAATTSLTTSSNQGTGLFVNQDGAGVAIQGVAVSGSAGKFTSNSGAAISAVARDPKAYGLEALNTSEVAGSGAAVRASATATSAIVATSSRNVPLFIAGPDDKPPMAVNSSERVARLNVDATDGWSFGCPESSVLSQGLCFELTARRAATAWDAADACQALDDYGYRYRLPSVQQLRAARAVEGIQISADGEHTDSVQATGDVLQTLLAFEDGAVEPVPTTEERAFRCVTAPLSVDLALVPAAEQERYPAPALLSGSAGPDGSPAD